MSSARRGINFIKGEGDPPWRSRSRSRRSGPRDPWLNEVAVALANFGFVEGARNTGDPAGGVPIEGDIRLDADRLTAYVSLFAPTSLRARPRSRSAHGRT